eukprot:1139124-Pelagomonas_calceolata.AAC.2
MSKGHTQGSTSVRTYTGAHVRVRHKHTHAHMQAARLSCGNIYLCSSISCHAATAFCEVVLRFVMYHAVVRHEALLQDSVLRALPERELTAALVQVGSNQYAFLLCSTQLKGVGQWTADMVCMFTLGKANVLPTGDLGVRKAFLHPGFPHADQTLAPEGIRTTANHAFPLKIARKQIRLSPLPKCYNSFAGCWKLLKPNAQT